MNRTTGQEPKKQYPFKTTKWSDLEDKFGIEKPLVGNTLNIGITKKTNNMKSNKLQEKKESLAKKLSKSSKGGEKAVMNVKGSFPKQGMKPKMNSHNPFPSGGQKPVMG